MSNVQLDLAITQMLCPSSRYWIKSPYEMTPEFIVIHNTWNTASAMNEISFMIRSDWYTSFHFAVDENQAVQGLPLNRNSWNAGDGAYGAGNRKGISIEICRSRSDLATYIQAEENGAKLTALLLYKYGWGLDKVKYHFQFMNKHCPHRMLDENRKATFESRVQHYLNVLSGATQDHNATLKETTKPTNGKVKIKPNANNYATGEQIPSWVKEYEYKVLQRANGKALLDGIYSWVYEYDLEDNQALQQVQINKRIDKTKCRIKQSATHYATGQPIADYWKTKDYTITQETSSKVLLQEIYSWVKKEDIEYIEVTKKSNEEIAAEVWKGKWGNYPYRKQALEKAGYDYETIQTLVQKGVGK